MQNPSNAPLFRMTEQAGHDSKQRAKQIHISKQLWLRALAVAVALWRAVALCSDIAPIKALTAVDSPLFPA